MMRRICSRQLAMLPTMASITLAGLIAMSVASGCDREADSGAKDARETVGETTFDHTASPNATDGAQREKALPEDQASPVASSSSVTLEVADAQRYQQALDALKGRVVLVDFWATWCLPCKKNLPKIIDYAQQYGRDGVSVMTVSIDDESAHDNALEFLTSVRADVTNLRSQWGAGTESAERFDFSGEVPFYKLYDRQGQLRYRFSASADDAAGIEPLDKMEERIEQLLAQ